MDIPTNAADRPPAPSPARLSSGSWLFLREAARNMRTTGAVAPSGKALAGLLAAPLDDWAGRPLDVLEAGAGTGSVTRVLLDRLCRGSRLDLVEANPRFAARLRRFTGVRSERAPLAEPLGAAEPFGVEGAGAAETAEVRVHEAYVQRLETGRRYDVIVSGLPLTNFTPAEVESVMERYMALLRPGGVLTWFAYRGTGAARSLLASRTEARRHRAVDEVLACYRRRYETTGRTAWGNLPPATVWRLRLPSVQAAGAPDRPAASAVSTASGAPAASGVPAAPAVPPQRSRRSMR